MLERFLRLLGIRSQAGAAAAESTRWYDLPNDATFGDEPYDVARKLRVLTTEIDEQGHLFTELYDLQLAKSLMSLYMMFANGCYLEMRAESESMEAQQLLANMAQSIGAFVPSDDAEARQCRLFRDKYDIYRCDPVTGVYIFVNPIPAPSAFPLAGAASSGPSKETG